MNYRWYDSTAVDRCAPFGNGDSVARYLNLTPSVAMYLPGQAGRVFDGCSDTRNPSGVGGERRNCKRA